MTEEVQTQEAAQPQAPQLNLSDLLLVLNVIQVVSQRGGVRADEMSAVGGLYDRLRAFLEANGALQQAQPQEAAPAEDAPAE